MSERVVVTGAGVITPLGDTPAAFAEALAAGKTALAPSAEGIPVAAIDAFDHAKYAMVRNMRMYNRATQLGICAVKLALGDAKAESVAPEDLGLLMASTWGHMDVLLEYDRSLVAVGMQRTNGALMPLAIPSAPGAMAALGFTAKAFSMTLSDGATSSLDAIGLGAQWLRDRRAKACIVASAISMSPEMIAAAARAGATPQGMGQAGVALVLERESDALARGAKILGAVLGYGAAFAIDSHNAFDALGRAIGGARHAAGMADDSEALAPVNTNESLRAALGHTLDASGALQVLATLASLRTGARALVTCGAATGGRAALVVEGGPR
jgi:3-oxoacyl-[acyl-carrier-protein] synthase II